MILVIHSFHNMKCTMHFVFTLTSMFYLYLILFRICHFLFFFQCPDSVSKKDLIAYLQRIALYCHQLNITSKVKADVQSVSGELIVSGVSVKSFF